MEQQKKSFSIWNLFLLLVFFFAVSASASITGNGVSIADSVFGDRSSLGRNLLQLKKECPVDFGTMNYTIFTSQCKAPQYPKDQCCGALRDFACPYADQLNDLTNDCATKMFQNIQSNGNYPGGLFAALCVDKDGLSCPAIPPTAPDSADTNRSHQIMLRPSPMPVLTMGFLMLLRLYF